MTTVWVSGPWREYGRDANIAKRRPDSFRRYLLHLDRAGHTLVIGQDADMLTALRGRVSVTPERKG